jgi:hypothetical protein
MSDVSEGYTVRRWSPACGPAPANGTSVHGGQVTLTTSGGELTVSGLAQPLRTDRCIDAFPTLARESHSRASDMNAWRTRCSTPAADPRHAVLNTLWSLSPDGGKITILETGRYEVVVGDSSCVADVVRQGTLTR